MMSETERIKSIFVAEGSGWLDFEAGARLFSGNLKLYIKIIKIFVDNIDPHLGKLASVTPEKIQDYAIEVHGLKGSLYGIGANREGDMALGLEMAAKRGAYEIISQGNDAFISAIKDFTDKLRVLLTTLEEAEHCGQKKNEPDRAALDAMLKACRDFDASKMQEILQELEKYEYEENGELVQWLDEQVIAFDYKKIEERLATLL